MRRAVPQSVPVLAPRSIRITRYVTPLREGGSLPAIVEADDDGMYVLKFRGAGQGARALIAELVAGEIARRSAFRCRNWSWPISIRIWRGRNRMSRSMP